MFHVEYIAFPALLLCSVSMQMNWLSVGCSAERVAVLPNECFLLVKYCLLRRVRIFSAMSLLSCASSEGTYKNERESCRQTLPWKHYLNLALFRQDMRLKSGTPRGPLN